MPPVKIPYLWVHRGRAQPCAYFRRGKLQVRIRDAAGKSLLPGDPGFLAAFEAVKQRYDKPAAPRPAGPAAGSLAALVDAYRASPEWSQLAPASQDDYNKALGPLRDRFGGLPVESMPREFVFRLRDEYAVLDGKPTPRRANRMISTLRLLLSWAVNRGWRTDNPAASPGQLKTGPGYATWRPADFAAFMACEAIGEPLKRACALGYYTGQRKQDCLAVTKAARKDGEIEFIPAKTSRSTGAHVWVPEHPALTRILDAAPPTEAVTLLTRPDGKPWREDHFNHQFADAVRAAGLPDGHGFHGLRKALSAGLASAGATDAEMDAVVYHADPRMSRLYRQDADRRQLAKEAMRKLVNGTGDN